jgi:hypothetical protein
MKTSSSSATTTTMVSSLSSVFTIANILACITAGGMVQAFQIPHTRHYHPIYVQYRLEKLEQQEGKQHQLQEQQQSYYKNGPNNGNRSRGGRSSYFSSHLVEARGTAAAIGEVDSSYRTAGQQQQGSSTTSKIHNAVQRAKSSAPFFFQQPQQHQEQQQQQQQQHMLMIPPEDAAVSIATPISYDEETGMVQTAVRAIVQHPVATMVDSHLVGLSSTLVISLGAMHELVDCVEMEWAHHATSSTEGLAILSLGHFLHYGRETIRQLVEMSNEEEDDDDDDIDEEKEAELVTTTMTRSGNGGAANSYR